MAKTRNRRKRKSGNKTIVKEVNQPKEQVDSTPNSEPKNQEKVVEGTSEVSAYKIPDTFPESTLKALMEIKDVINCPCEELTINFKKKQFVVKARKSCHIFDFNGNEQSAYTYNGSFIERVEKS